MDMIKESAAVVSIQAWDSVLPMQVVRVQQRPGITKTTTTKKLFLKGIFHGTALVPLALGENQTSVRAKAWRSRVK